MSPPAVKTQNKPDIHYLLWVIEIQLVWSYRGSAGIQMLLISSHVIQPESPDLTGSEQNGNKTVLQLK